MSARSKNIIKTNPERSEIQAGSNSVRFRLENRRAMHAGKAQPRHGGMVHERPRGCLCRKDLGDRGRE